MADISAPSVSPNLLQAPTATSAAELAKRGAIKDTAKTFGLPKRTVYKAVEEFGEGA